MSDPSDDPIVTIILASAPSVRVRDSHWPIAAEDVVGAIKKIAKLLDAQNLARHAIVKLLIRNSERT